MNTHALLLRLMSFAALLLAPSLVAADIPPPPGYIERCTIEKQCTKDEEGDACGAWHGERDKCEKKHAQDGFVRKCKTRGASVWTEIYCRTKKK